MTMKRISFFNRLFFGNILLVGAIITVSGIVSYKYLNEDYSKSNERHQKRFAMMSQQFFEDIWPDEPQGEGSQKLKKLRSTFDGECKRWLSTDDSLRLTVVDRDGNVLGDSQADPARMEPHVPDAKARPELAAVIKDKKEMGWDVRRSETLGLEFRYLAMPIRHDGSVVAAVRVAMPVIAIAQGSMLIRNALLWAAMAGAVIAIALGLLISWVWYSPLKQISMAAGQIASGDLSKRVRIYGSKELSKLGMALNDMRKSLAEKIDLIATQHRNLQAVVTNLREGVIAIDAGGHIVLMNAAAREMFLADAIDATGKRLQDVIRVPEVIGAFNSVVASDQPTSRQFDIGQQTVHLHAAKVASPNAGGISVLLVARDVTDQARTSRIKTEFVANASHELRTPLATIRAAVDSLGSLDADDYEGFRKIAGMLDNHTRRLENMVNDLLDLHLAESARQKLKLESITLAAVGKWAGDHFADAAAEKGVQFNVAVASPDCTVTTDRTMLQLILHNLLDNAIKFTPAAGNVDFSIRSAGDMVIFTVADTGCGIPQNLQQRVFERFFQVEASRTGSPDTRGTGLGLAIVKHAAERLGATITLKSKENVGTTVEVQLPAKND